MLAAIEIYNKPQIAYRDECFVILLINAWELILKAILSKNRQRIYYRKERNKPYRTFSISDALNKAGPFFPASVSFEPVNQNIRFLIRYRDNAIHFYNQPGFGVVIHGLAQTSITNYRDLVCGIFAKDIADEMTITLLPLSFGVQPDPIQFLKEASAEPSRSRAVAEFVRDIGSVTDAFETRGIDTARFLTQYRVKLVSVKKVKSSDVQVGMKPIAAPGEIAVVERRQDPNITHPLQQKHILEKIGPDLMGVRFTSYTFQAIARKFRIKEKSHLCWRPANESESPKYSMEIIAFLRKLSRTDIEKAKDDYRSYLAKRRRSQAV